MSQARRAREAIERLAELYDGSGLSELEALEMAQWEIEALRQIRDAAARVRQSGVLCDPGCCSGACGCEPLRNALDALDRLQAGPSRADQPDKDGPKSYGQADLDRKLLERGGSMTAGEIAEWLNQNPDDPMSYTATADGIIASPPRRGSTGSVEIKLTLDVEALERELAAEDPRWLPIPWIPPDCDQCSVPMVRSFHCEIIPAEGLLTEQTEPIPAWECPECGLMIPRKD